MSAKIVLVGAGGSGKDFLAKKFQQRGLQKAISYTTRPIRDGEQNGVDYHYVEEAFFHEMTEKGAWHEMDCYRGWYYGSLKEDFENKSLFIKTPEGLAKMSAEDRSKCFIIYLDIPESVRRERLQSRNDADSVDRRLAADRNAFNNFSDFDLRVTSPNF
jgi:guanylate kinase